MNMDVKFHVHGKPGKAPSPFSRDIATDCMA